MPFFAIFGGTYIFHPPRSRPVRGTFRILLDVLIPHFCMILNTIRGAYGMVPIAIAIEEVVPLQEEALEF